jgi:hypothetical protein
MAFYVAKSRTGWKVTDDDRNTLGEFDDKRAAEDEMVALSAAQNMKAGGAAGKPDHYRPALSEDVPAGRACGNCKFFDESRVSDDGTQAWCTAWDDWCDGGFYCDSWEGKGEGEEAEIPEPEMAEAA